MSGKLSALTNGILAGLAGVMAGADVLLPVMSVIVGALSACLHCLVSSALLRM